MNDILPNHHYKSRERWVDILNILSCVGVLLLHCTNEVIHNFSGSISIGWIIGLLTHSFFIWPVNVFFMLSGYKLIRRQMTAIDSWKGLKEFYVHRGSRIFVPVLFWNIVYMILFIYANRFEWGTTLTFSNIVSRFFQLQFNTTMWFFIPLIAIYIGLPFIAYMVYAMNKQMQKLFIIIGLLFTGIIPFCMTYGYSSLANLFPLGSGYFIIAVSGYYFGNFTISRKTRCLIYGLSVLSILIIMVGTTCMTIFEPEHYKLYIQYLGYPCITLSIGLFIWVRYTDRFNNNVIPWLHNIHIINYIWGKIVPVKSWGISLTNSFDSYSKTIIPYIEQSRFWTITFCYCLSICFDYNNRNKEYSIS